MQYRVPFKTKAKDVAKPAAKKPPEGRARLLYFDQEISKAKQAVIELQERIDRCESIIADADVNHRDLQAAIAADGGKALADYSAGNVPEDSTIAKLVSVEYSSARAATAAKASLPSAHAALENAKAQIFTLEGERFDELRRVLHQIADAEAQAYQKAFDAVCRQHDRLCGISQAIEDNLGDVRLSHEAIRMPRFALPSMGRPDAEPYLSHRVSDLTLGEAARQYSEIRSRLQSDALADISDILG